MTSTQTDAAPARQRIAKLMARVGLCSRRDAEAWIVDGRVSVNGEVLTSPALDVGPEDAILVDGAPLPSAQKTRLFLFHKPRGLVTSDRDPEGRATVADHLREHWPEGPRIVTIGRLDINTEGLLLLTNDGGLARMLELPKTGWVRRYRVRAKGETDQGVLDALRDGLSIDGVDYAGIDAVLDRTQGANVWLTMGLREGKNREVKRVLEHIGLEVNRLIRLSFGPFQLGELAEGAVEEVRTRVLRDQLGAALAAAAGVVFEDAPPPPVAKPARDDRKPGRTAGAERVNRGERPARAPFREERGRPGDWPLRRPRDSAPPEPPRERPPAGPRKHVSALRAAESEAAKGGPRRRIERSDVTDRRDRSVKVERLVGARPAPLETTRARGAERPKRRDEARGGPRQASPSALAKRARTARSGGYGTERDDAAPARRDERPGNAGRTGHAAGSEKRFDAKRPRRDASAPATPGGERSRGGDRRATTGERDRSRPDARPAGPRPGRPARGEEKRARGDTRRSDRPRDGDRRIPAEGQSDVRGGDGARRNGPSKGRPGGGGKTFAAERSGPRHERGPRAVGRGAGSGRDADKGYGGDRRARDGAGRDGAQRGDARRGASRGGKPGGGKPPRGGSSSDGPRAGGSKAPSRPGGGAGRGKPRPKR